MPGQNYLEETGDTSPCSAAFTPTSGSAQSTYVLYNPTYTQLQTTIIDLLGTTGTAAKGLGIERRLPMRHPMYPWLFADSVSHQGVGAAFTVVTANPGPGSAIIPKVPLYPVYHIRVNYSPRPYNCWQDKDIQTVQTQGFDKRGASCTVLYATEWNRFTTFDLLPTNNFLNAQHGQMKFRTTGPPGPVSPEGKNFQDAPKMYLPDAVLKVRWYQVPHRYLTSPRSYLARFIGYINQNDFGPTTANNEPRAYRRGSLLYHGAAPVQTYTPPVPDEGLLAFNTGTGFNRSKLCDLELTFTYTARTAAAPAPDFSAVNRNWVTAGHNLLPWLTTRGFYYAASCDPEAPTVRSNWYPLYHSFPFELLFADPDVSQPFGDVSP